MLLNGNEARKKWPELNIPYSSMIDDSILLLNPKNITIGHHVRIDAFCVLSPNDGHIKIGNYVHIAVHCSLFGGGGIDVGNFSNIAAYSILQSASDDFYGALIGPTIPKELTNVKVSPIKIDKHVILGMRTTILPGVHIKEGVGTGAHTLLTRSTEHKWKMYVGVNKLLYSREGYDRDDINIKGMALQLDKGQPVEGIIRPSDFAGNGLAHIHFDQPIEKYEVELKPDNDKDYSIAMKEKDKYGFGVFSYGCPKENVWIWKLNIKKPDR